MAKQCILLGPKLGIKGAQGSWRYQFFSLPDPAGIGGDQAIKKTLGW